MSLEDVLKIAHLVGLKHAKIKDGNIWMHGKKFDPENSDSQVWQIFNRLLAIGKFDLVDDAFVCFISSGTCFQCNTSDLKYNILSIARQVANDKIEYG